MAELLVATRGGAPSYAIAVAERCELLEDLVGVASETILERLLPLVE